MGKVEGVWFDWCDFIGGAIRNIQLREIGTIEYRWHMTKTSKHKSTTQHRKLKKLTTWASPKVRCSRRESSSWVVNIHRVRYTYLPFACPHVAHKGNYWLSSVLKLILVCIRNLVFMHKSSISTDIWFIEKCFRIRNTCVRLERHIYPQRVVGSESETNVSDWNDIYTRKE